MRRGLTAFLASAALVAAGFCYGFYVDRTQAPPYGAIRSVIRFIKERTAPSAFQTGRWVPLRERDAGEAGLTAAQQEKIDQLRAIGYASGTRPASGASGVTIHRKEAACAGLNFYVSGHRTEAILMDMEGRVLHTWRASREELWRGRQFAKQARREDVWRRAYLFPNGDVLAIFDGDGLVKLDKESKVLWSFHETCHHDLEVTPEGRIYTLTRDIGIIPRVSEEEPVVDDVITVLDSEGRVVREVSILKAIESSDYAPLLARMEKKGELFHANTLEVFDGSQAGRSPLYQKGNVLVSLLTLDTIVIIDMERERVVWALSGLWKSQHQPTLLANGNMLVFDNVGYGGSSRVLEIDPLTQRIAWMYAAVPREGFASMTCGSNQRLPNGNTLITESDAGAVFEVTREGEVVWEFRNPERAGRNGELIAAIFEMVRYDSLFAAQWLRAR